MDGLGYMTKIEAAEYLRIGVRTLDRLCATGELVGARIGGRRLLFRRGDLDGYVSKKLGEAARN